MHITILAIFFFGVFEGATVASATTERRFIRQLTSCDCEEYTDKICRGYYMGGGSSFLPEDYKTCAPVCCLKCDCQKITVQTCKDCLDKGECASEELYACAKQCCESEPIGKPTKAPHIHVRPTEAPHKKNNPTPEPTAAPYSKGARNRVDTKKVVKGVKGEKKTFPKQGKSGREKKHSAKKQPTGKSEGAQISIDSLPESYVSYIYHDKHHYGGHWKRDDSKSEDSRSEDRKRESYDDDSDDDDSNASGKNTRESNLTDKVVEIPNPSNSTSNTTLGANQTSPVAPDTAPVTKVNVTAPVLSPAANVTSNVTRTNTTIVTTKAGPTTYEILLNNTKSNSSNSTNSSSTKNLTAIILGAGSALLVVIAVVAVTSRRVGFLVCSFFFCFESHLNLCYEEYKLWYL